MPEASLLCCRVFWLSVCRLGALQIQCSQIRFLHAACTSNQATNVQRLNVNMDAEDDMEIDPAIAAAMGFSSFGIRPGQKRKFDANDGYIDPEASVSAREISAQGKGANAMPLGDRKAVKATGDGSTGTEKACGGGAKEAQSQQRRTGVPSKQTSGNHASAGATGASDLRAFRNGVRNEQGDMVYFLPSFLEDPWKDLEAQ